LTFLLQGFASALFSEEVDPTEVNQLYRNFLKVKVRYHKLELERLSGDFSTDPQSVFHADMDLEKAKEKQVAQQHIENEQRLIELEKAELLSSLRDELTALLSTISRGAEPVTKAEEPSILLSELWEQFKAEKVKIGRWRSNTIRNHTPKFTAFKQFVGDIPVNYVTKAMARDFRMLLDHLPPNFTKKGYQDFSEITLSDLRDKHDKTLIWLTVVKRKKNFLPTVFSAVLLRFIFQGTQRGGTSVATVDHSDIRGLATA